MPCDAISSAVAADGLVYVASKGMTALRPIAAAEPEVVWNAAGIQPGAASTVAAGGRLFVINRSGVLVCASAADGESLAKVRLAGEFWGTPVLAGNRLYCVNKDGAGQVVEINPDDGKAEIIGHGKLEGTFQASPAISDGAIYLRSDNHLWKIAAP